MKSQNHSPVAAGQSLETIPSSSREFIARVTTVTGNPLDLRFESMSNGVLTLVYLASITSTAELQTNIMAPLANIRFRDSNGRKDRPGAGWDRVLPLIHERDQWKIDYNPEERQYVREGLAVFNGDRLAGELTAEEAQMFGLISGEMKSGSISFQLPPEKLGPGHRASLRDIHGDTRIRVRLKNGLPHYT